MDSTRLMRFLLVTLGFVLVALVISLALNVRVGNAPADVADGDGVTDDVQNDDGLVIPVADDNYTASPSGNIRVAEPDPNDTVGLPLVVKGEARVFENTVSYRLLDADGTVLIEHFATADAPDVGQFGDFSVSTSYPTPSGETGTLEVFVYSARDGSEEDVVSIPVRFDDVPSMNVNVYFQSDAPVATCDTVTAVSRRIPKTQAVASAALTQLLAGPTAIESEAGMRTSINSGVTLKRVAIEDGVATVEFSPELEDGVAGSCLVEAIRTQIEATLLQFPTVESVVILVEGKTADEVLQP